MGLWRARAKQWLSTEQQHELDGSANAAADAAFRRLFAVLPGVVPSDDFVRRTAAAAWRGRLDRHRRRTTQIAAAIVLAMVGSVLALVAFVLTDGAGPWLGSTAQTGIRFAVTGLMAAATLVEWWSRAARISSTLADVLLIPQGTMAIATIALVGAVVLFTLRRLLRTELKIRTPPSLCA
jgi:hypothetical protein